MIFRKIILLILIAICLSSDRLVSVHYLFRHGHRYPRYPDYKKPAVQKVTKMFRFHDYFDITPQGRMMTY